MNLVNEQSPKESQSSNQREENRKQVKETSFQSSGGRKDGRGGARAVEGEIGE
jgi:hypothetical protein